MEKELLELYLGIDNADVFIKELKKKYGKVCQGVLSNLILFYMEFEDKPNLQQAESRLPFHIVEINNMVDDLYRIVEDAVLLYISSIYMKGASTMSKGIEGDGRYSVPELFVEQMVTQSWAKDGQNFIQRLNRHKTELKAGLVTTLEKHLVSGSTRKRAIKDLENVYGIAFRNSERLVRTEVNYFINKAILEVMKTKGYEQYMYSAILDARTSDICRSLDGTVHYLIDAEAGVNMPPMHPNCRSFIYPVN